MSTRPTFRWWCGRVALALLVGVALTVLVAAGCSLGAWMRTMPGRPEVTLWSEPVLNNQERLSCWVDRGPGHITIIAYPRYGAGLPSEGIADHIPSWSRIRAPAGEGEGEALPTTLVSLSEYAVGWPMLTLRCDMLRTIESGKRRETMRWAWVASEQRGGGTLLEHPLMLPRRPIWPGFIANSLFYAGLAMALLHAPGALRWMARRRRGRCSRCGYDLRGSPGGVCGECGTPFDPRRVSAACCNAAQAKLLPGDTGAAR